MITLRYPSGQPMPQRVSEALWYMGKVGILSKETWEQHFSTGQAEWKNRQLLKLQKRGAIKSHSCTKVKRAWVLADASVRQLQKKNHSVVLPVLPQHIDHDELVGISMLRLQREGICVDWTTEKELKSECNRCFQLSGLSESLKYPDAIFKVRVKGSSRNFALEYERTGKSIARYRSILTQYSKIQELSLILYIVESEVIENRIRKALSYMGEGLIAQRLAFASSADWKEDPSKALIRMRTKAITLEDLGQTRAD